MYIFDHMLLSSSEMFQIKVVDKIKTQFIFNNFFMKIVCLWDNVEK